MANKDKTSIAVSRDTKDRLDKLGCKGDTYDDIIRQLIRLPKKNK